MDFDRLNAILKERKISRRKLALSTGINEHTMSTAFRRKSGLSVDEVIKIADFLGVDYYFLEGWNRECDENFVEYYYKNGIMVDVPFEKENHPETIHRLNDLIEKQRVCIAQREQDILKEHLEALGKCFKQLNDIGRAEALKRIGELTQIPEYRNSKKEG